MHPSWKWIGSFAAVALLSGCATFSGLVRWTGSEVYLGAGAWMTGVVPWFDEDEDFDVTSFTAAVDIEGLATIGDTVVCDFELTADAAYGLSLVLGPFMNGFSGSYNASGSGFNTADCAYEAFAEFEWVFTFEVLRPTVMSIVADLTASSSIPVLDGRRVHGLGVRPPGGADLCCGGLLSGDDLVRSYDESVTLQPGVFEFWVYAFPLIASNLGGGHTALSAWTFEPGFQAAD